MSKIILSLTSEQIEQLTQLLAGLMTSPYCPCPRCNGIRACIDAIQKTNQSNKSANTQMKAIMNRAIKNLPPHRAANAQTTNTNTANQPKPTNPVPPQE